MPISFPTTGLTPNVTTYTYGGLTWLWTGSVWQSVGSVSVPGTQGVQGNQGLQGGSGPQGVQGTTGTSGVAGAVAPITLTGSTVGFDTSVSNTFTAPQTVAPTATGVVPLTVSTPNGSTANIASFTQSGGTYGASINQFGQVISQYGIFGGTLTGLGARNNFAPNGATTINTIFKNSSASQTADIIQIQNSSDTVLSGINALGQVFAQTTTPITSSAVSQSITAVSFTSTTATYTFSATVQTVSIGEYVTISGIAPSGYNGTYQVTAVATVSAGSSYSFTVANTTNTTVTTGTGLFNLSASVSISTQNKARTGLVVKAVTGQTASIMEIQNSLNQPVTWWDSTGGMTASQVVASTLYSGGFLNTGTLGYLNATTFNAATSPVVVRGAASQTAVLQQWQNSSGTLLSSIDTVGNFTKGDGDQLVLASQIF